MAVDFGKMYGPLPLGAWIAVVGGSLAFMLYSRNAGGNEVAEPVEDTSPMPGVGTGYVGGWVSTVASDSGSTTVAGQPVTNEEWANLAINHLIAKGYDAAISASAIGKYIGGLQEPNAMEWSLVRIALGALGAPPIPLTGVIVTPPTVTPTTPPSTNPGGILPTRPPAPGNAPKPSVKYYTVKRGDTLSHIAKVQYGNARRATDIYNANRVGVTRADGTPGILRNINLIYPNQKLVIP